MSQSGEGTMRRFLPLVATLVVVAGLAVPAAADDLAECRDRASAPDAAIAACTRLISSGSVKGADLAQIFLARGGAWRLKGDVDRAIADFDAAIRVDSRNAGLYEVRGNAWFAKRDYDRAVASYDQALALNPRFGPAYVARANARLAKGEVDAAVADYGQAIELSPRAGLLYAFRGNAWRRKGDLDRAIADYGQAIRVSPGYLPAYISRALSYEAKGDRERARADYEAALAAPARGEGDGRIQETARTRMGMLGRVERSPAAPTVAAAPPPSRTPAPTAAAAPLPSAPPPARVAAATPDAPIGAAPKASLETGPRVALVIGNGAYVNATALANPPNDAAAVARTLRELGFDVIEGTNLDRAGMERLVRDFLHKAPTARLTLLYYAGHGMQVDGRNYLVPVDAKLSAPSDLAFETMDLDKIMAGLDDEARANIIILDACRDNPLARSFASRLGASRSTAVAAGLAGYATVGTGTLIAFATAPGQTALDGDGKNSPFTTAFVKHVRTPGIEINQMLTRVRIDVATTTKNRQVPWANSSLLGEVYIAGELK